MPEQTPTSNQSFPSPNSDYQETFQKIVEALEKNDSPKLYELLYPEIKNISSYDTFRMAAEAQSTSEGQVTKVEVISPPTLNSGGSWDEGDNKGKWVDGRVAITRDNSKKEFTIRLVRQDQKWWLFGTIEN